MSLLQKEKTARELRDFGFVMAIACLVFAGIGVYKRAAVTNMVAFLLFAALSFIVFSLLNPQALRPLEKRWMQFAEKLSVVMTFVIMSLTFFLMVTPIGILSRIFRKDPLERKIDKNLPTYWTKCDKEIATRFFNPY